MRVDGMQWVHPVFVPMNMNPIEARSFGSKLRRYFKDPSVSAWRKLAGVGALAYLVMPLDVVPDIVPFFGVLDDIGLLSAAAMFMVREVKKHAARDDQLPPVQRVHP